MPRIFDIITLDKMIGRQIALWDAHRRRQLEEERPGRATVGAVEYGPYLLVSREVGSGGQTIAHEVGRRLGWQVFDRRIVDEIASRAQVRRRVVESVDERVRPFLEHIVHTTVFGGDLGDVEYKRHLMQVVLSLGQHGDVVIVGRGARHILPGQCGLSVRFIAPLSTRVKRIAHRKGITIDEAQALVQNGDRERAAFVRCYFESEIDAPLDYDLVINTGDLSIEAATAIVLAALTKKLGVAAKLSGSKDEFVGERIPALAGGRV